jgi:hypothetical protein
MARKGYVHPSQRPGAYTPTRGHFVGQTFASYRQYQNASARTRGFASAARRLAAPRKLSLRDGLAALARPSRVRALEALSRVRAGESIATAAREAETTIGTVKRYAGSALRKGKGGRVVARRSDQLPAVMEVITTAGFKQMLVVGSRSRSLVGSHTAAVRRFLGNGNIDELRPFVGKTVNVEGAEIPLVTDPRVLTRLGREGRLSIESLYAKGLVA